jgi:hypothetical protein
VRRPPVGNDGDEDVSLILLFQPRELFNVSVQPEEFCVFDDESASSSFSVAPSFAGSLPFRLPSEVLSLAWTVGSGEFEEEGGVCLCMVVARKVRREGGRRGIWRHGLVRYVGHTALRKGAYMDGRRRLEGASIGDGQKFGRLDDGLNGMSIICLVRLQGRPHLRFGHSLAIKQHEKLVIPINILFLSSPCLNAL